MPYLTELHAHTSEVSLCARLTATEVVDRYIDAGYSTLVISNHFNDDTLKKVGATWEEKTEYYINAYRKAVERAGSRLHVLLGMEVRFPENMNDYLIFGLTEDYILSHPYLYELKLREFCDVVHRDGLLVVQAHPFRTGMTVAKPELLDGYEVFNGANTHHSHNQIARLWCRKFGKIPTSGSDFHYSTHETNAGILTDEPIESMEQLCTVLRSGNYAVHCSGQSAEDENMTDFPAKEV